MGTITVRNLDEAVEARLRVQAARHGRSMEDEVRAILRSALSQETDEPAQLGTAIHELFKPYGGFDLPERERKPMREPPDFTADSRE